MIVLVACDDARVDGAKDLGGDGVLVVGDVVWTAIGLVSRSQRTKKGRLTVRDKLWRKKRGSVTVSSEGLADDVLWI